MLLATGKNLSIEAGGYLDVKDGIHSRNKIQLLILTYFNRSSPKNVTRIQISAQISEMK